MHKTTHPKQLGTGFSGEPLGLSVGLDGEENYKCIFDMCVDAARVEETTGRDLSVVVRTSDGTIIGACICTTAEAYGASNDPPSDTSDAAKRLFAVMNSAFKKARLRIVELGLDPCVPELALSCVHPDFRGSFIKDDDGNPTRSMYQEMCHTIEQKVALYWNGMYSHSYVLLLLHPFYLIYPYIHTLWSIYILQVITQAQSDMKNPAGRRFSV